MKKLLLLLLTVIAITACKDPDIGPDDGKPLGNAGQIKFETPAVGQKSTYIHFYAQAYWGQTPSPLHYTQDTITWEIVKQIDAKTFSIRETLSGTYFTNQTSQQQYTLVKDGATILIYGNNGATSPLLGYQDSLVLTLSNPIEINFIKWKIDDNIGSSRLRGYVRNYLALGKKYDKLDIYTDLTPMTYDGSGAVFIYNAEFGLVRSYFINPWTAEVNGFDLLTSSDKPTDEPIDLNGTKWRLKNVYFKDGSVKEIGELSKGTDNPRAAENFKIFFNPHNEVLGMAGCKNFKGDYKTDGSNLTLHVTPDMTTVWCEFGEDYVASLNTTTSYSSDGITLTINVEHKDYVALEFEMLNGNEPGEIPLSGTKWQLLNLETSNGEVLPLEKILNLAPDEQNFSIFSLNFADDEHIGGLSGCNTFGGEYELDGKELEIEVQVSTEMACKFSGDYQYLLNQSYKYTADEHRLIIFVKGNHFRSLIFGRVE
jgi:heat shock protein HslJ